MSNESGLNPRGRAVLIRPYIPERNNSLIVLPDTALGRDQMLEQRAIVVAVGPVAWIEEPEPRAKVGDKVIVSRYAGYMAQGPRDSKQYRFINDKDIFATIDDDVEMTL